jgi:hypothetical protein
MWLGLDYVGWPRLCGLAWSVKNIIHTNKWCITGHNEAYAVILYTAIRECIQILHFITFFLKNIHLVRHHDWRLTIDESMTNIMSACHRSIHELGCQLSNERSSAVATWSKQEKLVIADPSWLYPTNFVKWQMWLLSLGPDGVWQFGHPKFQTQRS